MKRSIWWCCFWFLGNVAAVIGCCIRLRQAAFAGGVAFYLGMLPVVAVGAGVYLSDMLNTAHWRQAEALRASILVALYIGKRSYGLALIDAIPGITFGGVAASERTIYPALHELESAGLVASADGDPLPERGGRPRLYYVLTEAGQREAGRIVRSAQAAAGAIQWASRSGDAA